MSERINRIQLLALVYQINKLTNNPTEDWYTAPDGKWKPSIGNYHLDWNNGRVRVEQHIEGGGVHVPFNHAYKTKRGLYDSLREIIVGIKIGKGEIERSKEHVTHKTSKSYRPGIYP